MSCQAFASVGIAMTVHPELKEIARGRCPHAALLRRPHALRARGVRILACFRQNGRQTMPELPAVHHMFKYLGKIESLCR